MILTFLPALPVHQIPSASSTPPENQATKPRRAWASTRICWRSHEDFLRFFPCHLVKCNVSRTLRVDVGRWDWRSRCSVCCAISSTFVVRASGSYTSTAEREPRWFRAFRWGAAFQGGKKGHEHQLERRLQKALDSEEWLDNTGERVSGAAAISWGTVSEDPPQPLLAVLRLRTKNKHMEFVPQPGPRRLGPYDPVLPQDWIRLFGVVRIQSYISPWSNTGEPEDRHGLVKSYCTTVLLQMAPHIHFHPQLATDIVRFFSDVGEERAYFL